MYTYSIHSLALAFGWGDDMELKGLMEAGAKAPQIQNQN